MSVAFRRESDEEHLEPKFELPIPAGPNLVTARGLGQIKGKVAELEALLPALTDDAAIAAIRRELRYWGTRQATAQAMPMPDGGTVEFGATVIFLMNGQSRTITIVGDDEADPREGLLSFSAPLCRAMIGAQAGDLLDFAGKADVIEILAITVQNG